jgi:hypothetical protein
MIFGEAEGASLRVTLPHRQNDFQLANQYIF